VSVKISLHNKHLTYTNINKKAVQEEWENLNFP